MIQRLGRLPGQPPRIVDHGPAYGSEAARQFVGGVFATPAANEALWGMCRACHGEFRRSREDQVYCSQRCAVDARWRP